MASKNNIRSIVESAIGIDHVASDDEVVSYCPFHDDRNTPNFYTNIKTGEYICYACGAGGVIRLDTGTTWHRATRNSRAVRGKIEDWPPSNAGMINIIPAHKSGAPKKKFDLSDYKLEESYTYTDRNGAPLSIVKKYISPDGKKYFKQYTPSGDRVGDTPNVPLHLKDLYDRGKETIILVEGEKCANFLFRRGYLATTFAGGANYFGSVKRPIDYNVFGGRNVVLMNDNDRPGFGWLIWTFEKIHPISERVGVISPSMLKLREIGDDIHDWYLKYDGKFKDFDALVEFALNFSALSKDVIVKMAATYEFDMNGGNNGSKKR